MHGVQRQDQELVGEAAARLPWLCPSADALIQLTSEPAPLTELSNDVGLVLLALRYARSAATLDGFTFASLRESVVAEAASKLLESHTRHWLNPTHPVGQQVRSVSIQLARVARELAEADGTVSPDAAAAVGLIAPLGWWAVATMDPAAVEACGRDSRFLKEPYSVQRATWGLSQEEIVRRLCAKWRLPAWVSACITTLSLSVADAVRCGADPDMTRILRAAVEKLDSQNVGAGWLKTPSANQQKAVPVVSDRNSSASGEDPRTIRLLPQLLRATARARRAGQENRLRGAEQEVDRLYRLLADLRDGFEIAVRDAKLSGLAELAAGAGHEINNPLAVISGNAQRLKKNETDDDRRKALDSIIRQSTRISDIVRELMQYARPAAPNRSAVDLSEFIAITVADFQPQASVKGIRLTCETPGESATCFFDLGQVRKALHAVLQNAIDAVPPGGEIGIRYHTLAGQVVVGIEDTGPGPSEAAVPHLFDPFYSGRSAGRGRGLGLATAWRLANINGGELSYQHALEGVTRFELTFPTVGTSLPNARKLA
ncbi:sensor histidine kinase [Limnoglobus roseus]|uniref:histidine kinase n=1 Tax=Limnoglobus roseus TaxID=2598579 RepID=A0A5C1AL32_9BACT|nr:ATP-binding protein [Limnoglobus roseus]QEL18432.1 HDOD domain-containing protein [Limnoglobus roseus]